MLARAPQAPPDPRVYRVGAWGPRRGRASAFWAGRGTLGGRTKQADSGDAIAEHAGQVGEGLTGAWEVLGGRVGSMTAAHEWGKLERLVLVNLRYLKCVVLRVRSMALSHVSDVYHHVFPLASLFPLFFNLHSISYGRH